MLLVGTAAAALFALFGASERTVSPATAGETLNGGLGPSSAADGGLARGNSGFARASGAIGVGTAALERAGIREVIVRHSAGSDVERRATLRDSVSGTLVKRLRLPNTEVLRVPVGRLAQTVAVLNARDDVEYAEVNAPVQALSNDTYWSLQWGLSNTGQSIFGIVGTAGADIDAPTAWQSSTGTGITVAVVDTGADMSHPDLSSQLTGNPAELGAGRETNRVDDDGNGLVDDWRGWDFVEGVNGGDATPGRDNLPEDLDGHGTHVAGTVAALRDNGAGVAGVAPNARAIALRALGADGSGSVADAVDAFDYAGDLGVAVVNASLGGPNESLSLRTVIRNHPQTLYVVAAGNGGDDGIGDDVDVAPQYPCATDADNVLCVGASDNRDARADFSNHGSANVDLFAPGVDIASTYPIGAAAPCDGSYCVLSGTSMAAPHAAGVAALVAAAEPTVRGAAIKQALMTGAEPKPAFSASVSSARLDATGALTTVRGAAAMTPVAAPTAAPVATEPAPAPAAPIATPTATPTPTPVAAARLLSSARLSSATVRGRGFVRLIARTSRPAEVTVTVRRRGSTRRLARLRVRTEAGVARFVLRRRLGGRTLSRGRYRLTVVARSGTSMSRTLDLRVA